jgi:hypothetical protein
MAWFFFGGDVDRLVEAHLRDVFEFQVLRTFGYDWEDLDWWLIRRWWEYGFLRWWVVWV